MIHAATAAVPEATAYVVGSAATPGPAIAAAVDASAISPRATNTM